MSKITHDFYEGKSTQALNEGAGTWIGSGFKQYVFFVFLVLGVTMQVKAQHLVYGSEDSETILSTSSCTALITNSAVNSRTGSNYIEAYPSSASSTARYFALKNIPAATYVNGQYVHAIMWVKGDVVTGDAKVTHSIGPYGTSPVNAAAYASTASSYTRFAITPLQTGGSAKDFRVYFISNNGSPVTHFFYDDVISYMTATNVPTDLAKPNAPTFGSCSQTQLSWSNGVDVGSGASGANPTGIQATILLKNTNVNASAPVLNDQAPYHVGKNQLDRPVATGDWEVVSVTIGSAATTYNIATSVSTKYAIVHRDLAYNYSVAATTTVTAAVTSTTWTTGWSDGNPSATIDAIIDGDYTGTGFDAKKLTVNSNKSLTITSGNLTVQNEVINNGTLTIENNANLIQVNSAAPANQGVVTIKRNSNALKRLDYTLWSSPVAGQNLAAFSPLTSLSPIRFYTYNTTYNTGGVSGIYTAVADPTATSFAAGTGYLIRMPNEDPSNLGTSTPYYLGTSTLTYNGVFTGVPNNGNVPFTLVDGGAGLRFNLVGNPYPSPISIPSFIADNAAITSTLYFWRRANASGTGYCTYNSATSTFAANGNAGAVDPAGVIQTGQGFIVEANGSGTALIFKNTHRIANNTGQFFRTKQSAKADKVWLNAVNAAGDFSQTAVTYSEGADQGVDATDSKYINDSSFALTSNINNEEYTIQGRPVFDASDVVPLNFKTAAAGDYTISIDHTEGVFAAGQDVILVDSTTGTETSLKSGSYTFTATSGASNSRFALKYQKTLGVNDTVYDESNVAVYKNKGVVAVASSTAAIAGVKVYDIQGKLLAELKDVNAVSASISGLKASNQVLVVQVTLEGGAVVTKKVVN